MAEHLTLLRSLPLLKQPGLGDGMLTLVMNCSVSPSKLCCSQVDSKGNEAESGMRLPPGQPPPLHPHPSQPAAASGVLKPQEPCKGTSFHFPLCNSGQKAFFPAPSPPLPPKNKKVSTVKDAKQFILLLHNFSPPVLESVDAKL